MICRRKLQIVPETYSYKYQLIALYMSYITLKASKRFIKRKILVVLGLIKQKVFLNASEDFPYTAGYSFNFPYFLD